MPSTYSTSLRIELIGAGEQVGTWNTTTNNNLGTLIEQSIAGVQPITMLDANYTLTNYNGVSDEARQAVIVAAGSNTATRDIIAPLVEKVYIIKNSTSGGHDIRITASSGAAVTIPNGATYIVYCDGTDFNLAASPTVVAAGTGVSVATVGTTSTVTNTGVTTLAAGAGVSVTGATGGITVTNTGALSFNTRTGAITLTSGDVTGALGYTPPTPTGTGASGTWGINISGNAATVTNGVYTASSYADPAWITSLAGAKITGTVANASTSAACSGNSATVTNGVYTSGSYADPAWLTSLAGAKITGTVANATTAASCSGNAATATTAGYITNASYNGYGLRTVSSSSPTGGSNGDIWYKI